MSKNAELIAVGTEIILGDIVNTHSQYLSQKLAQLGINVYYHTSVGDNPARLRFTIEQAIGRSDIVILSGGLGPTEDDLTKETVCDVLGLPLHQDAEALARMTAFFERIGREMTENNIKQSMVPDGAVVFQNDRGTAPGMAIEKDGKIVILLPGPPSELIPMFEEQGYPYLQKLSDAVLVSRNFRVFGVGESMVEVKLGKMLSGENPTVALYAKQSEVLVRVTAKADTKEKAAEMLEPVVSELYSILGDTIYGEDVNSLEEVVVPLLKEKGMKIATAESCTGGLLSQKITSIPGSSEVFECGVVSYANRIKHELLGVPEELLERYGAVSEQVATAMSEGVLRLSGADIGVGITGIAGPGGGSAEKPVGTVYISVAAKGQKTCTQLFHFAYGRKNERDTIRYASAMNALDMVRRLLL
jgi:nicotinamide-nucleotide amidase